MIKAGPSMANVFLAWFWSFALLPSCPLAV
jgi:hypothetical protein